MKKDVEFRRTNERKTYTAPVVFSHQERAYSGHIKNVSLGGAFIISGNVNHFSIGDRITVSIPFTSGGSHVKRNGRVKWINDEGFGIEFV